MSTSTPHEPESHPDREAGSDRPSEDMLEKFAALRHLQPARDADPQDRRGSPRPASLLDLLADADTLAANASPDTSADAVNPDKNTAPGPQGATDPARRSLEREGRYDFGAPFASGGLGVVRRAEDRLLGRVVAVKELQRGDPRNRQRFMREAAITARLQHPGIVPLYDFGLHATGEPYYCMKLVEGRTLEDAIRGTRRVQDRLALIEHVIAASEAIAYAHRHGVIHRDLKPANILLGEFGETVVIDWGMAKDLGPVTDGEDRSFGALEHDVDRDLTQLGSVLGTLRYMPPEQARGEPVDARSDVFALGTVLYHVLAGSPPFAEIRGPTLRWHVSNTTPADLRRLAAGAPHELVAIAQKAMARAPEQRYPDARMFAEDLRRFLTGRLVSAHQYSLRDVLRRWLRRHRSLVAMLALASLAVAAIGVYAIQNVRSERDTANDALAIAASERAEAERQRSLVREQLISTLHAQAEDAVGRRSSIEALSTAARALHLREDPTARGALIAGASGLLQPLLWSAPLAAEPTIVRWHAVAGLMVAMPGQISRWDTHGVALPPLTGPELRDPKYALAPSPSGQRLAVRGFNNIWIYDLHADLDAPATGLASDAPYDMGWLDEDHLVATEGPGAVTVWRLSTNQRLGVWRTQHNHIRALAVRPGLDLVVSASHDRTIRAWNPWTVQEVGPLAPAGVGAYSVDLAPDGSFAAAVGEVMGGDGKVRIWDLRTHAMKDVFQAHNGEATMVRFSPDGRWLATGGRDGAVRVWHVPNFGLAGTLRHSAPGVPNLAFSPDSAALAVAWTGETELRVWSVAPDDGGIPPARFADPIERVAWSPDGRRLAAVDLGEQIHVLDATSTTTLPTLSENRAVAWDAAGEALGDFDPRLAGSLLETRPRLHQITPASPVHDRVLLIHEGVGLRFAPLDGSDAPAPVITCPERPSIEFLTERGVWWPDGSAALIGSRTGLLRVPVNGPRCVPVGPLVSSITTVAIAPSGGVVAAATSDAIALFDLPSWTPRNELVLDAGQQVLSTLQFSAGGEWLLAAHWSGHISVWRVADHALVARWRAHDNRIWTMELAPDGRHLATGSGDRTIRIWDLAALAMPRDAVPAWAERRSGDLLTALPE